MNVTISKERICRAASHLTTCAGCCAAVRQLLEKHPLRELRLLHAVMEEQRATCSGANGGGGGGGGVGGGGTLTGLRLRSSYLEDPRKLQALLANFPLDAVLKKVQPAHSNGRRGRLRGGDSSRCPLHKRNASSLTSAAALAAERARLSRDSEDYFGGRDAWGQGGAGAKPFSHALDGGVGEDAGWDWEGAWERLPDDVRRDTTIISMSTLESAMQAMTAKHRFCVDCRGNVEAALDVLIGRVSLAETDHAGEFVPELYRPFTILVGDESNPDGSFKRTCIYCDMPCDEGADGTVRPHNPQGNHQAYSLEDCADEDEDDDGHLDDIDDIDGDAAAHRNPKPHPRPGSGSHSSAEIEAESFTRCVPCEPAAAQPSPQSWRDRKLCVDEEYVEELIYWYEDMSSQEFDTGGQRHAATLEHAQREVRSIVGAALLQQLRLAWQSHMARVQSEQFLFYLCVDAVRTDLTLRLQNGEDEAHPVLRDLGLKAGPFLTNGEAFGANGSGAVDELIGDAGDAANAAAAKKSRSKRKREKRKEKRRQQQAEAKNASATPDPNPSGSPPSESPPPKASAAKPKTKSKGKGKAKAKGANSASNVADAPPSLLDLLDTDGGDDAGDDEVDDDLLREMEALKLKRQEKQKQGDKYQRRKELALKFEAWSKEQAMQPPMAATTS
mmetsp:Transcript_23240/g.72584  ORF Transcript_23240/g.72584 Transcript_23240/m.72584 type:complete len:670 (-) Transcript_23240:1987-3996(-)